MCSQPTRYLGALSVALVLATGIGACRSESGPTIDEARRFVEDAEARLLRLWIDAGRAAWIQNNFITDDTNAIAAEANTAVMAATTELAAGAARFNQLDLPADLARKLTLLKTSLAAVAPSDPLLQQELSEIVTEMESMYGRGEYCPDPAEECLDLPTMERIFADVRETDELLDIWGGWRDVSPDMRPLYVRFVELSNAGAQELGFADTGDMWRSGYDMPPDAFTAELERLWGQVSPLYESLHCHVRAELGEEYGSAVVPDDEPIPAHLLGNMWSQSWGNVHDSVGPSRSGPGYDLTDRLERNRVDELEMVRYGERFFSSLGFEPLPPTFWDRSLFIKPEDHEAVCHASAWDLDFESDLRIKMCIGVNDEDFVVIHHELGHNYYQRAYSGQDPLYRTSANDGFHEGIGDTIALSITPEYLVRVGLSTGHPRPTTTLACCFVRLSTRSRSCPLASSSISGGGGSSPVRFLRRSTTRHGGSYASSIRASGRRCPGPRSTSTPGPSITCPPTRRIRGTSWPTSSSSSFTAPSARWPAWRDRFTAVRSSEVKRQARGWRRCSRWERVDPGPTPSR